MITTFLNNYIENGFSNTFTYNTEIEREDRSNYGIIYTPFNLVEEQLAQIPNHYFENPSLRWLDIGAGIGNYSIILFKRLYIGLMDIILDNDERSTHIIEKMIYMVEVFPDHVKHLKNVFGEGGNIIDKCFLSLTVEEYGVFDFIIGNPPYNINGSIKTPTNSKLKKQDDGKTVYVDFVYKSLELLKPGGFLNYIIPSIWLKPDKAGLYETLTNLKIHSITPFTTNDTQKYFKYQAQTPTCYFLIENIEDLNDGKKVIKIWDKFLKEYIDYRLLLDWPIPCHGISIINKLIPLVEKYGNLSPYKSSTLRKNVKIDCKYSKLYPHKNISTCRLDGLTPEIMYNWSDHECQYSGKTKLVLAHKMYGFPYMDISGECGISTRDNYILTGITTKEEIKTTKTKISADYSINELQQIQAFLSTKTALFVFSTTNYRMRYLERYAFQFLPNITKMKDFPNLLNSDPATREKLIINFFNFSQLEEKNINNLSQTYNHFIDNK